MNLNADTIITCDACGAKNRIPQHHSEAQAKCGKCHAPLNSGPSAEKPLVLRCSECGGKNRVPPEKLQSHPQCGKCHAALQTDHILMDQPITVTDTNFEKWVVHSPLPVLLDCWATWCGACRMAMPVIDQLAAEWKGRIRVCRLDVDQNPATASRFHVQSTPTALIFDKGQLVDMMVGAVPKNQMVQRMGRFL